MTRRRLVAALVAGCLLAGCTPGTDEPRGARSPASSPSAAKPPPPPYAALGLDTGWGPTAAELDRATRLVRRLRLGELAGQVIVADYGGTAAPVGMVRSLHLGGVIAFSGNVVSTGQARAVNARLQRAVTRPWPLLLGVDQEGGTVQRVGGDATRMPAFMSAGAAGRPDLTRRAYAAQAAELRGLGFTTGFSPDADVTAGPRDPVIRSRSAGSDPAQVRRHVLAAAQGQLDSGVLPVLKHFPGHGSAADDSHVTLPVLRKDLRALRRTDLVPFRAAVGAGLPAVMMGHLSVPALDRRFPTSLSRRAVAGLLRRELGFDGLVVTDSLEMGAVAGRFPPARVPVQALRAGVDVLLMPPDPAAARTAIIRAVREGRLPKRRLQQAAARMVALLLHQQGGPRGRPPGSARPASRALSAAALTAVAGPCGGRLVGGSVVPYGDPVAVAGFAAAARAAGLPLLARRTPPASLAGAEARPRRAKREKAREYRRRLQAWERREARRTAELAAWQRAEDARMAAGTSIGFTGYGDAPADGEVAVATDTPYVLGSLSAPVRIATYGDTPGAMSALVDVLLGRARAPGRLPVPVPGVPRRGC